MYANYQIMMEDEVGRRSQAGDGYILDLICRSRIHAGGRRVSSCKIDESRLQEGSYSRATNNNNGEANEAKSAQHLAGK